MCKSIKNLFYLFLTLLTGTQLISCQSGNAGPKNIIVFISDGCGYNQVNAASIYQYGEIGKQIYEHFPVKYGMSTYPVDGHGYDPKLAWASFDYVNQKVTDSAASATTMATGVKTLNGSIGVNPNGEILENISERVEKFGKASGVVSSVMFSHATPAGFSVHNKSRGNYEEIANSMIKDSKLEVIMGCGHPLYDNDGLPRSEKGYRYVGGEETWNSLVEGKVGNDSDGDGNPDIWVLVENQTDFQKLMSGPTAKRVIGIPKVASTLQQSRGGDENAEPYVVPFTEKVPTLEEMTKAAINVLDEDPDGFFLMVEGGAIDWASHGNLSGRVIEEEIDFNKAIEAAVSWIEGNSNWDETLVIITGDHETGYLTGPGSNPEGDHANLSNEEVWKPLVINGKGVQPGMEWHSDGHTNSLIPFFAKGVGSEEFKQRIRGKDPVRGDYLDDSDLGQVLLSFYPVK